MAPYLRPFNIRRLDPGRYKKNKGPDDEVYFKPGVTQQREIYEIPNKSEDYR